MKSLSVVLLLVTVVRFIISSKNNTKYQVQIQEVNCHLLSQKNDYTHCQLQRCKSSLNRYKYKPIRKLYFSISLGIDSKSRHTVFYGKFYGKTTNLSTSTTIIHICSFFAGLFSVHCVRFTGSLPERPGTGSTSAARYICKLQVCW